MINNPTGFSLTHTIKDCGHKPFKCGICNKNTRFGFVGISRKKGSGIEVLVGIECAKKLYNPMADAGDITSSKWIADHKSELLKKAKYKRLTSILLTLKGKEPSFNFSKIIDKTIGQQPLSPAQAQLIVSLSSKNKISISIDLINVSLRKEQEKTQVKAMSKWQVDMLSRLLGPRQKLTVQRLIETPLLPLKTDKPLQDEGA
jgi:hypothetical protein